MDKERLVSNMNALIAREGKKVGEVENAIGVSQSYLGKLSKPDSKQIPSIETVANLADLFGVTIDELLYGDLSEQSETERKLRDFILALGNDTKNDVIEWVPQDFDTELARTKTRALKTHVIFDLERGKPITPLDYADGKEFLKHPINPELFGSAEFYMDGDCYRCRISEKQDLYIFRGTYGFDAITVDDFSKFYALVIDDYHDFEKYTEVLKWDEYGNDNPSNPYVPGTVRWLYNLIGNTWFDIKISKKSRNFIDSYLQNRRNEE